MRTPPLLADFSHARGCKLNLRKILDTTDFRVNYNVSPPRHLTKGEILVPNGYSFLMRKRGCSIFIFFIAEADQTNLFPSG